MINKQFKNIEGQTVTLETLETSFNEAVLVFESLKNISEYEFWIKSSYENNYKISSYITLGYDEELIFLKELKENTIYHVKVRPISSTCFHPFSNELIFKTKENQFMVENNNFSFSTYNYSFQSSTTLGSKLVVSWDSESTIEHSNDGGATWVQVDRSNNQNNKFFIFDTSADMIFRTPKPNHLAINQISFDDIFDPEDDIFFTNYRLLGKEFSFINIRSAPTTVKIFVRAFEDCTLNIYSNGVLVNTVTLNDFKLSEVNLSNTRSGDVITLKSENSFLASKIILKGARFYDFSNLTPSSKFNIIRLQENIAENKLVVSNSENVNCLIKYKDLNFSELAFPKNNFNIIFDNTINTDEVLLMISKDNIFSTESFIDSINDSSMTSFTLVTMGDKFICPTSVDSIYLTSLVECEVDILDVDGTLLNSTALTGDYIYKSILKTNNASTPLYNAGFRLVSKYQEPFCAWINTSLGKKEETLIGLC